MKTGYGRLLNIILEPYARFDHHEGSFYLVNNPFPEENIHPGPYKIGKNVEDANNYRIGHSLAQRIIDQCKKYPTENSCINF